MFVECCEKSGIYLYTSIIVIKAKEYFRVISIYAVSRDLQSNGVSQLRCHRGEINLISQSYPYTLRVINEATQREL